MNLHRREILNYGDEVVVTGFLSAADVTVVANCFVRQTDGELLFVLLRVSPGPS
jgi:hypothetical protein